MEKQTKSKIRIKLIGFIGLAVVLGFIAGISGEFFTRYYLANFSFFRDLYFMDRTDYGQGDIVIREPRKVVVEQDLRVNQIKNEIQLVIMGIYKKNQSSTELIDTIFTTKDSIGQALILTSDGWLISADITLADLQDYVVIGKDKKIYEIEKVIEDELTGVSFIKISAQNLPVIKFSKYEEITAGQQVYVYNQFSDQIDAVNIKNKRIKYINNVADAIQSSEILDKYVLLNKSFSPDFQGSPVISLQGEIIGLLISKNKVLDKAVPIHYIDSITNQVLKQEAIKRPYLGIKYIDLSLVYGLSDDDRQGMESGALIWAAKDEKAILPDSPLVDALVKGDIIISIENQKLDQDNDLLDILLQYKTGQEIFIKYLHNRQENEVSVILK